MKTIDLIKSDEGLNLKPYKDTVGVTTIGYGHNLSEGISQAAAEFILQEDIAVAERNARKLVKNFDKLTEARQGVLINMSFNLGYMRLLGFKKFLAAVSSGDYQLAVKEMLDSVWAKQVGDRAKRLANIMQ